MLCLYLLGQNCLHLTSLPYLGSETYSRKYVKLPNIVIHACKCITEKCICWKCVARKFGFVYLRFDPLCRNSYMAWLDTLSWFVSAVITHPLWVQEVPGSIPGSGKGFYVWFFVLLLLLCFYFLSKITLFVTKVCNSFYNVKLFSILNIFQDLWPIIRV